MNARIVTPQTGGRNGPDLNDVALFVDVVRATSFTIAARRHGVPVSTVSRRVARLEERLATRLLERTTRRLRLTDAGESYFAHAERALDELHAGSDLLRALVATPRGRVRITAPIGFGTRLTTALAPYLGANPDVFVQVDLTERRTDLLGEGFDIGIRAGPVDGSDFVARKISETVHRLFASDVYLERCGRPRTIADLRSHALIATHASASGSTWELYEDRRGEREDPERDPPRKHPRRFTFEPRLLVNELSAARNAVAAGIGIGLLPSPDWDRGELIRVLPSVTGSRKGLWLLYPARRSVTAAVRSCAEHLVNSLPFDGFGFRAPPR